MTQGVYRRASPIARRYEIVGSVVGKKQDRALRWRKAKVPDYANDQRQAYTIDQRRLKGLTPEQRPVGAQGDWKITLNSCRSA